MPAAPCLRRPNRARRAGVAYFDDLLAALTWAAVAVLAVAGALSASRKQLDPVGFILIACLCAFGGGTVRDLILGAPGFWLAGPGMVALAAALAVAVFFTAHLVERRFVVLLWADAVGLGLFAVALGYYARYQLMAGQVELEDSDLEMALSGGIGIALSFVLAQMFRLTSKEHKAMQSAGVFAMVCAFHNFAFWAPGPMTVLFSPEYVARIQTEAPPNSARFRGTYFPLFDKGSAAAEVTEAAAVAPVEATEVTCAPANPEVKRIELENAKKKPANAAAAPCE